MTKKSPTLFIISTPIGNLNDISLRAIDILKLSDFIICENPKHSIKLLNKLGIKKKLYSLHDYNEERIINKIEKFQKNSTISLISDAGSPLISDPGYKLVQNFIKNNICVSAVPGPSSVITSLQLSGFPINNFAFYGFVPKSSKLTLDLIEKIKKNAMTGVIFISGKRLKEFLKNLLKNSENFSVSLCKELTKVNEAVLRGNIEKIFEKVEKDEINLKGEFTVVVSLQQQKFKRISNEVIEEIAKLLKKYSLTEVVKIVHKLTNISKKDIYEKALKIKNE